ncbi:MAG: short-chain dehydrogenase [Bacteroidota bacterium]
MDIAGKTVLVLGGWGLVGSAICRKLMEEKPRRMVVASLTARESREAVEAMRKEFPSAPRNFFIPWWGNIFVRSTLRNLTREAILTDPRRRAMLIDDVVEDLNDLVLRRSSLYQLMMQYRPDIVVDSINSATAIAYQNIFQVSRDLVRSIRKARGSRQDLHNLREAAEHLLCTLYIPQVVRHVQLMYRSMQKAGTTMYVKIGTSGTGGMGLNIPYTHSEEKPSRMLLAKSAVAGAHTLLLFLMGRTPDAPITKEIKPAAAIAWKKIAYGDILKRGRPIRLVDCPPGRATMLGSFLNLKSPRAGLPARGILRSVFIDTGENGIFSRGEFQAISTPGQMEFVTPEEIAESAVFEIRAGNTGHDIINALDNAALAPTYRAGFLFNSALEAMLKLEREHGVESVAFEMLGPPRLSKLLYEAYLLKRCCGTMRGVLRMNEKDLSRKLLELVRSDAGLRSRIISIGIPILLPDGVSLLRGREMKIPPFRGERRLAVSPRAVNLWAHDGWVDLRPANMRLWRKRMREIMRMVTRLPADETGSRTLNTRQYWDGFRSIDPGKVCGWIFTYEEKGERMKA